MRYVGQSYTLAVPLDADAPDPERLRARFAEAHVQTFGHADAGSDSETVNIRLVSLGRVDRPPLSFRTEARGDSVIETRPVWFDGAWHDCPVHDRARMASGATLEGPAIIEEDGGTAVVPPGWRVTVHESGALICRNPRTERP
jgi:N-methylhydantoinase A